MKYIQRAAYRLGRITARFDSRNPVRIVPYRGFGNGRKIYLKGRVLEEKGVRTSTEKDSFWTNLLNTYKRFESDEIPGARLLARFHDIERELITDREGYFDFHAETDQPIHPKSLWHEVHFELLEPSEPADGNVREKGLVLIPPPEARFGVISDMDDTVLETNATSLWRMARTVLLGNARTRLPFKGVAAFYQALHEVDGRPVNPLFYVSSSPWNLYDLLLEFFELQKIPVGPLLLRDWGISDDQVLPHRHRTHKLATIRQIMDMHDHLPFILIGDSGQKDPEIYHEIVSLYPDRILAVYIRNVSRDLKRPAAIHALAKKIVEAGSTLILAEDTLAAAKHAIEQGWISAEKFPEIVAEKQSDEKKETVLKKMISGEEHPPVVKIEGQERKSY